jgi:hypothetical protein
MRGAYFSFASAPRRIGDGRFDGRAAGVSNRRTGAESPWTKISTIGRNVKEQPISGHVRRSQVSERGNPVIPMLTFVIVDWVIDLPLFISAAAPDGPKKRG